MSKGIKIGIITAFFLTIIVYIVGNYNPISMEFIITQHGLISEFIEENYYFSIIICILIIAFSISLMGPITPVCILSGFYYGLAIGLVICIIGEVIGALIVFLYGRYFFKNYLLNKLGTKFKSYKDKFNRNAISYLLFIRVIGGVPFGIQNLLPAIFDMKFRDYLIATIFGVLPWAYILSSVGSGIGDIVEAREFDSSMLFNLNYFLPILLIGFIVLSPIAYKFINKKN
tara:strand:+ start:275 stop:961 length:687 start_codon:yes stop_codon:yes gene_type:complete